MAKKCTPPSFTLWPPLIGNKWSRGSKQASAPVHCACHCSHITVKMKSPNVSNCDLGNENRTNERTTETGWLEEVRATSNLLRLRATRLNEQRKYTSSRFTGQSAKLDWLKKCCWISGDGFLRSYSPLSRIFIAAAAGARVRAVGFFLAERGREGSPDFHIKWGGI